MSDLLQDSHERKPLWIITTIWLPPIILFIGTVGNIVSFMIFNRIGKRHKRRYRNDRKGLTVYSYLSLLAVLDLGVLYFGILNEWLAHLGLKSPKDNSVLCCKLFTFFSYFFSHSSSFVLVMTLGTRFLAIYYPVMASSLTAKKNVKRLSCLVMLIFAMLNSHYLYHMNLYEESMSVNTKYLKSMLDNVKQEPQKFPSLEIEITDDSLLIDLLNRANLTNNFFEPTVPKCVFRGSFTAWWVLLDQIFYSLAPFFLLFVFSILIIRNLSKFEKKCTVLHISKPNRNFKTVKNLQPVQQHIDNYKKFHLVCRQFSIMLASLSCCFLAFTLPSVVLFLANEPLVAYSETIPSVEKTNVYLVYLLMAQRVSLLLMYLNHSSNFFVYYLTNPRYRLQCLQMFGCSPSVKICPLNRRRCKESTSNDSDYYK